MEIIFHLSIFFLLFLKSLFKIFSLVQYLKKLLWTKIFVFPDGVQLLYMVAINRIPGMRTRFLFTHPVLTCTIQLNRECAGSAAKKKDIFIPAGEIQR